MSPLHLEFDVLWDAEAEQYLGLCAQYPTLATRGASRTEALRQIFNLVSGILYSDTRWTS